MKNKIGKNVLLIFLILSIFFLGFLTKTMFDKKEKLKNKQFEETEFIIDNYSSLPDAIDSIENLSVCYYDTATIELLHYVVEYSNLDSLELSEYYVTKYGDTIMYNKDNFFYYVAMYKVAENLLETRMHIINGLLLNKEMEYKEEIKRKTKENPL